MILEMFFLVLCTTPTEEPAEDTLKIFETITSRVLDGANLCLLSITLLYLFAFAPNSTTEELFLAKIKVNTANKIVINLFRFFHLFLFKLKDGNLTLAFLKKILLSSSEVYLHNPTAQGLNETELVSRAASKQSRALLEEFPEFIEVINDPKARTYHFGLLISLLKKAYYTIALKVYARLTEGIEDVPGEAGGAEQSDKGEHGDNSGGLGIDREPGDEDK